ncbi:MAG: hypothetical protein H7829_10040 [Magnetococcus sp. THC-1_WYH]
MEKEGKTYWHRLIGETLKVLLEPVGIEVRVEVPVVSAPPVADLILIQRKETVQGGWTREQRLRLADGLRDLEADQILAELKITEHLDGEKKEAAKILTCLLQRRFGAVPTWATQKIATAESPSLEEWSLRFVDAQSLDDVFSDKV